MYFTQDSFCGDIKILQLILCILNGPVDFVPTTIMGCNLNSSNQMKMLWYVIHNPQFFVI